MAEEVYGFNSGDCDAVLKLIGKTPQPSTQFDRFDATRLVLAYTSAGATARSGMTLGKGTAVAYYLDVSGSDLVLTSSETDPINYYNLASSEVGTNKFLMLLRYGDKLLANWEDCV